ncbi:MAG TPA: hypothetical protein VGV92_08435 [Gammaproteobacteria bacterium]|nr:hypothetical protein [Gammaproteobacteria bacterium]
MKLKLGLVLLAVASLTGCATISGPQSSITHQPEQKELNVAFNTAKDGTVKSWVGVNDGTRYHLTTSNTHVNYQGVPCRDFTLVISKSFYRGETLTGTACRYDNQWTDIKSNDE